MRAIIYSFIFVFSFSSSFAQSPITAQKLDLTYRKFFKNINPKGTKRGVVVASPSKSSPDYFYHWTRDAALVMRVVLKEFQQAKSPRLRKQLFNLMDNYVEFSRENQLVQDVDESLIDPRYIMGEAKFHVDGQAYNKPWGRPQNDGPALRAVTLIEFAASLLSVPGGLDYIAKKLYRPELPAHTVIKADLEYTAHYWKMENFDYWEEVKGLHFTTLMAQRKALHLGSLLARTLGDKKASQYYGEQAIAISKMLNKFWSPKLKRLKVTLETGGDLRGKTSGLDVASLLGVLHSEIPKSSYSILDPRIQSTMVQLKSSFQKIYPINHVGLPATAIGRYPEDIYDGVGFDGGNPWFLAIHAYAEYYYRLAHRFVLDKRVNLSQLDKDFLKDLSFLKVNLPRKGELRPESKEFMALIKALVKEGDSYLKRSEIHSNSQTGSMAEQINRNTGYMRGARDLTWSYASLLTAWQERKKLMQRLPELRR